MKTTSWVILVIVGALLLLGSLASLGRAYISAEDQIGPASLTELSAGRAGGGGRRAGSAGNGGRLRCRVCNALPGHHSRPLPPR